MVDRLFGALASDERRRLLAALVARGLDGGEVAIPHGKGEQVWGTSRTRLYHVHLPKLDEAGVVEWDRTERRIERGPQFDEARRLLQVLADRQRGASADA